MKETLHITNKKKKRREENGREFIASSMWM